MPVTRRSTTNRSHTKDGAITEQVVATNKQTNPVKKQGRNDNEVEYKVEQIIKMDNTGGRWMYLVSWVGYDDVTWEPTENIPSKIVGAFRWRIRRHKELCEMSDIKQIHDMVDGAKDEEDSLWLFQVSWMGCDHLTWEPEDEIKKSLVSAFRDQFESNDSATTRQ